MIPIGLQIGSTRIQQWRSGSPVACDYAPYLDFNPMMDGDVPTTSKELLGRTITRRVLLLLDRRPKKQTLINSRATLGRSTKLLRLLSDIYKTTKGELFASP